MKKALITFLAVFYLGVSSGATLHYQYCNGKLINVSLGHHKSLRCNSCGIAKSHKYYKKCCQDKHQQLKTDKNQKVTDDQLRLATPAFLVVARPDYLGGFNIYMPLAAAFPVSQSPPKTGNIPAFIRNCTFRI